MNILKRISDSANQFKWLSPLMGGRVNTITFLIKNKISKNVVGRAVYKGLPFFFRPLDISVLKEILVLGEYSFIKDIFSGKNNPVILDIGANIGVFSIWALSVNRSAKIFSVEASPHTYSEILQKNVNELVKKNIMWRVCNNAAWKNNDEICFSEKGTSSLSFRVDESGNCLVRGMTLSDIFKAAGVGDNDTVDIMKVDIEGAEEAFICSAEEEFKRINNIIIELHPLCCDTAKVEKYLAEYFPHRKEIEGRTSSKPVVHYYR